MIEFENEGVAMREDVNAENDVQAQLELPVQLELPKELFNDVAIIAVVRGVSVEQYILDTLKDHIQDNAYQLAEEVYDYFINKYKKEV